MSDTVIIPAMDPPSPAPSINSVNLSQAQAQLAEDVIRIPDLIYSVAFTVLWLFGLARNLGSYVVSLGIIPLKTATHLFGIGATNQTRVPLANRPERGGRTGHGSRHTNIRLVEHASNSAGDTRSMTQEGGRYAWITHNKGQNKASSVASSSSSADTGRLSGSVPSSPRRRSKTSLPPNETCTDTEQSTRRSKRHREEYRASTGTIKDEVATSALLTDGEVVDNRKSRSRSKVDHSTRRILFVDSKPSRRQTAPLPSTINNTSQGLSIPAQPAQPVNTVVLTESPNQAPVALPRDSIGASSLNNAVTRESIAKAEHDTSAEPSRPTSVSQFGEFVSATSTSANDDGIERGRTLGNESATEGKKDKATKEKSKGSSFKLFGRKRSNSISGQTAAQEASSSASGIAASCAHRLRRKSLYPAKVEDKNGRRGEAVTMSDAEVSSSYPTSISTSWLRSRPKRLTKKGRSSSVSSDARVPSASSTNVNTEQTRPSTSSSWLPIKTPTTSRKTPTTPESAPPPVLTRSSTSATQNSICATPNAQGHSRSRFNPIRDLEAHLYNKHGVGTGPGTADPFEYRITPVPKEGIKRTNPYELLGIDRRSTSSANTPTESFGKREKLDEDKKIANPRRISAPAGSLTQFSSSRPHTPSRSHTQPL
ncbi:hypothetical protein CPB86DRAFT_784674 [Serendipita vermifera]|nr:hypothetical protein CPB86DRAFT_784674 [Serendipita vermifera]